MQNETLRRFWADWKNVIIVTILVIINITSLTWAPIIASWFKSDPAEIEHLAKYIQDTMWLIVFIYAAQIIFSNRKFYGDSLSIMRLKPQTAGLRCVHPVYIAKGKKTGGANPTEAKGLVAELQRHVEEQADLPQSACVTH